MTVADQIGALPPDAIAQVVNAYRDAYDAVISDAAFVSPAIGPARPKAHEAGCAAFREALAAVLPPEAPAPAFREAPHQSWLPDTFIERAYRAAQRQEGAGDVAVGLSVMEASAIRQKIVRGPLIQPPSLRGAASRPEGDGAP